MKDILPVNRLGLALVLGLGLGLGFGLVTQASAQDPEDDGLTAEEREARSLFDAGRAAFSAGRFDEAYERFLRAYDLAPRARATLVYNLASAADRAGRDEAAVQHYREFLEHEPEAQNRGFVEARIRVLEARIAPSDDEVEDEAVDEPELMPQTAAEAMGDDEMIAPPPPRAEPDPTLAIILFTVAGLSGIAAIATGALAWDVQGDLEGRCPNGACPPELRSRGDTLDAYALATDILAGTSAAFAVAGLIAAIVGMNGGDDDVQAACGPGGCALRGRF